MDAHRCPRRVAGGPFLPATLLVAALVGPAYAGPDQPEARDHRVRKPLIVDKTVAIVNDTVILDSELRTRVTPLVADLEQIADERERQRRGEKIREQMLDEMIDEELIVQAATEAKLEVTAKEIQSALEEIKKQNNLDEEGLKRALAAQGYTIASYRTDVRRQILRMRAVNLLVRPRVTITDEDVRARYDEMTRRSESLTKVHLQHILIALPEQPSEEQVAAARARAAEVIERARAGTPFDELAKQYSDDERTRDEGGSLGWIERGSIATEWEVIVFAMSKGEVRGPISGPRGLHVFHVVDIEQTALEGFEQLKEKLRNELYGREMDKQTRLWMDELRKKAHVVKL
jgi:parvulin-like peptidyl-prolyl isomerase